MQAAFLLTVFLTVRVRQYIQVDEGATRLFGSWWMVFWQKALIWCAVKIVHLVKIL